jgi:hypothetical protein
MNPKERTTFALTAVKCGPAYGPSPQPDTPFTLPPAGGITDHSSISEGASGSPSTPKLPTPSEQTFCGVKYSSISIPQKPLSDPTFSYTPSHKTDIRKTFARVRRELKLC